MKILRTFRNHLRLQGSYLRRKMLKPVFPKNEDGKVLLHIGCGKINSPEFVNVDARPLAHVHVVTDDITNLAEFADGSADMIYMCHILEHIKQNKLAGVLSEMKRVLKTGGVLRLSVPDIDRLMSIYESCGRDVLMICRQLMGGQDHEYNVHYSIFNEGYLRGILQEVGFSQTRDWDPETAEYHNFKDRASRKLKVGESAYPISLNIEAVK